MDKINYYIKPEISVTAVLDNVAEEVVLELHKSFRRISLDPGIGFAFFSKIMIKFFKCRPSKIRAKAKRDPNDKWDEDLGIRMANARLEEKVNMTKYSFYTDLLVQLDDLVGEIEMRRDVAEEQFFRARQRLDDLHDEVQNNGKEG